MAIEITKAQPMKLRILSPVVMKGDSFLFAIV
jgi:hypothetical protein